MAAAEAFTVGFGALGNVLRVTHYLDAPELGCFVISTSLNHPSFARLWLQVHMHIRMHKHMPIRMHKHMQVGAERGCAGDQRDGWVQAPVLYDPRRHHERESVRMDKGGVGWIACSPVRLLIRRLVGWLIVAFMRRALLARTCIQHPHRLHTRLP